MWGHMPSYVTGGLEQSFPEILAGMFADYQARLPTWRPNPGAPECLLMEVFALRHAVRLESDSVVLAQIYTYFGTTVAGIPFREATAATVNATVTINAEYLTEAHTIPAGLRVSLVGPNEEPVVFEVIAPVTLGIGVKEGTVVLLAQEPGAEGSGLTGAVTILDPRAWIQSIVLLSETAGGEDAEEEATYRDRLVAKERRDSPTIITAIDAQEAILEIPGVGRCLILNNYVPKLGEEPAKEGVPGAFTAVVSDAAGANVSKAIKEAAQAIVESERLLDLNGYVIDPTRTNVAVTFTFNAFPGWDPAVVKAEGEAAVTTYLSDATWGQVPGPAGSHDWEDELLVRYSEIYGVLNTAQGLNHVLSVHINTIADTNAVLVGPGALPTLTSVVGTAV
jgi:hypothetical protein